MDWDQFKKLTQVLCRGLAISDQAPLYEATLFGQVSVVTLMQKHVPAKVMQGLHCKPETAAGTHEH
eukprot:1150353-Pelagomonas_calceolata.AAC.3